MSGCIRIPGIQSNGERRKIAVQQLPALLLTVLQSAHHHIKSGDQLGEFIGIFILHLQEASVFDIVHSLIQLVNRMLHTVGQEEGCHRGEQGADQQHHSCPDPIILESDQQAASGIIHAYMSRHNKKKQRERADQHTANQKFRADGHKDMTLQREIDIVQLHCPVSEFLNQRNNGRTGQIKFDQCMHAGY
ncbi:hypothetical protein D3C80_1368660 [compost metagenome]